MEALLNQVRRAASEAASSTATTRHGTISSYDPDNRAVKVELQPDGTLTGWIPLKTVWSGNGWGAFFAPAIGTAVEVHFQEADGGVGSAGLSFHNDVERPLPVPAGEMWLVHASGASIKLTTAGAITLTDAHGAMVNLPGDGTIHLDDGAGAMLAMSAGDITSAGTWAHTGTLSANGIGLTTHTHTDPQGGNTGAPQ